MHGRNCCVSSLRNANNYTKSPVQQENPALLSVGAV